MGRPKRRRRDRDHLQSHRSRPQQTDPTRILNHSIQFFIIYVPSKQLQGQLQTQHSVDTGSYIKGKHNIKTTATYNKCKAIPVTGREGQ
jgi:hypothetical protein